MSDKKIAIIVFVIIVALVLGVGFGSSYMGKKRLDANMHRFMQEYHLQSNIGWENSDANIWDAAHLHNLQISDDQGQLLYKADRVEISQWLNTDKTESYELTLDNFRTADDKNPLLADPETQAQLASIGISDLRPLKLEIKFLNDLKTGETSFNIGFNQDGLLILQLNSKMDNFNDLIVALRASDKSFEKFLNDPAIQKQLLDLRMEYLRAIMTDQGYAYNVKDHIDQGVVDQTQKACVNRFNVLEFDDPKWKCNIIMAYVSGEADGLAMEVHPKNGITVGKLIGLLDAARGQVSSDNRTLIKQMQALDFKVTFKPASQ